MFHHATSTLARLALCFLAVSSALTLNAKADDQTTPITTIRLDQNGGAFATAIPVYDQLRHANVDAGDCYAIAASELIDAYRFRQNGSLPTLTAPLSVTLLFHTANPKTIYKTRADFLDYANRLITGVNSAIDMTADGGSEADVFSALLGQSVCDQRFLQPFDGELASKSVDMTLLLRPADDNSTENFLRQVLTQVRATQNNQSVTAASFFGHRLAQNSVDKPTLTRALKAAAVEEDPARQSLLFTQHLCSDHLVHLALPALQVFVMRNPTVAQQIKAFELINGQLEKGHPVAIFWSPTIINFNFGSEPSHESVVIGRRLGQDGKPAQ